MRENYSKKERLSVNESNLHLIMSKYKCVVFFFKVVSQGFKNSLKNLCFACLYVFLQFLYILEFVLNL